MDAQEFGAFVQSRRKELGMNQTQLAEKLHVTAKAVSRWERGVGFPSIELLQPLADALEISIAELMQSKRMEKEISKESAEKLVSDTVETIRKQEALTWKGRLILYGGYAVLLFAYIFLTGVGREIRFLDIADTQMRFDPRHTGFIVATIGVFIWHFGSRALYCLLTGAPYYEKPAPKWKTRPARIAKAVFFISFVILIAVLILLEEGNVWRDLIVVLCLAGIVGSGMCINQIEQSDPCNS